MNTGRIATAVLFLFLCIADTKCLLMAEDEVPRVIATSITNGRVAIEGLLGKPLGTPIEIECNVIEWTPPERPIHLPPRADSQAEYRLRVDRVDGVSLGDPVLMQFDVPPTVDVYVASNRRYLETLIKNLTTSGARLHYDRAHKALMDAVPISADQADAIRRDYVGSRHKLVVFESGCYVGRPPKLPDDCATFDPLGRDFVFYTFLVVLAER